LEVQRTVPDLDSTQSSDESRVLRSSAGLRRRGPKGNPSEFWQVLSLSVALGLPGNESVRDEDKGRVFLVVDEGDVVPLGIVHRGIVPEGQVHFWHVLIEGDEHAGTVGLNGEAAVPGRDPRIDDVVIEECPGVVVMGKSDPGTEGEPSEVLCVEIEWNCLLSTSGPFFVSEDEIVVNLNGC